MTALAAAMVLAAPLPVLADDLQQAFDSVFGARPAAVQPGFVAQISVPVVQPLPGQTIGPSDPHVDLQGRLAALANASMGRIGVAVLDLSSGRSLAVLGDQPFPLASTGKLAIVATFLDGVDQGRFHLADQFPLMIPLPSHKFAGSVAPVRQGEMLPAEELIELALTRSDNHATDALLAAIGGPATVDGWLRRAGISGMHLDRDIATLVRDDGVVNPAHQIDPRDSTTPLAMVRLLGGFYAGQWLSPASREVLLGAMSRCQTGIHRMRSALPEDALIGHKTGSLANTSSDVGIIRSADGRTLAVAIYVTGQANRPGREQRIASITRAIYDRYSGDGGIAERGAAR